MSSRDAGEQTRGEWWSRAQLPGSNPSSATDGLCDLGQVTKPLCATVSSAKRGDNCTYLKGPTRESSERLSHSECSERLTWNSRNAAECN